MPAALPVDALDDRIAIVGTAGSGKIYAAKGFVERFLDIGARVAIIDPLGVWCGLRASATGYPVVVFGERHADVAINAEIGSALGRMITREALLYWRSSIGLPMQQLKPGGGGGGWTCTANRKSVL